VIGRRCRVVGGVARRRRNDDIHGLNFADDYQFFVGRHSRHSSRRRQFLCRVIERACEDLEDDQYRSPTSRIVPPADSTARVVVRINNC